jgi:hypothetical protein
MMMAPHIPRRGIFYGPNNSALDGGWIHWIMVNIQNDIPIAMRMDAVTIM